MSKGQAKITDSLFAIFSTVIFIVIMFAIISKQLEDFAKEISLESADVVAKDMAGFITISGAAPDGITITYKPSTKFSYNLDVSGRVVKAESFYSGNEGATSPGAGEGANAVNTGEEKIAVDTSASLKNAQTFIVTKSVQNGEYAYNVKKG